MALDLNAGALLDRIFRDQEERISKLQERIEALERAQVQAIRTEAPARELMRWNEVIGKTGLSRSTLSREIRACRFPAPETLSRGREGFRTALIEEWIGGRRDWSHDRTGNGTTGASSAPRTTRRR